MRIVEQTHWDGRVLSVAWDDSCEIPARELITQASGVVFVEYRKIVLVRSGADHWSLPGGHLETNESAEDAFVREVLEEACVVVEQCKYLGAQEVSDPSEASSYYQTRWWGRGRLLPFEAKYETTERILIDPANFVTTLGWDTNRIAKAILEAALAVDYLVCPKI